MNDMDFVLKTKVSSIDRIITKTQLMLSVHSFESLKYFHVKSWMQ